MRDRRVAATYLLGHDRTVRIVPRWLARCLSGYERALLRLLVFEMIDHVPAIDAPFVWLARRLIFALAGRPRDRADTMLDAEVDLSGWAGNAVVVVVWTSMLSALAWLLRRWPPA